MDLLVQQNGDALLQEDGFYILLDESDVAPFYYGTDY